MMRIGGHVSAAGGIGLAPERALTIGANCLQIFISPPQGWRKTEISDEQVAAFKTALTDHDLGPVFIHALYLVNLATPKADLREKSIDALAHALRTADRIGAQGVIYHTGSRTTRQDDVLDDVVSAMREVLKRSPGKSQLIIENSAGHGGTVGGRFEELAMMRKGVDSARVNVCLDICHAFAVGYDLRTPETIHVTLDEFDRTVGLEHLVVVHANDIQAKYELGAGKDRHENIGQGAIGSAGFKALLHNPHLRKLPWILEVPGFAGEGPDAKNVEILQRLAR